MRYLLSAITLALLMLQPSSAFGAQPETENDEIAALIADGRSECLKAADNRLIASKLENVHRVHLWVRWLEVVQTRVADIRVADDFSIGFLERLPKNNLDSEQQKTLVRAWVANEQYPGRAARNGAIFSAFAEKVGVALINWCAILEEGQDQYFDLERKPWVNPPPPDGSMIIPGQDAVSIKDPVMRVRYENIIKENAEYAKYYALQLGMRRQAEDAANSVASWIQTLARRELVDVIRIKAERSSLSRHLRDVIFGN